MVRPATPVAVTPASSGSTAAGKPNYVSHLQSGFQALLLRGIAPQGVISGPLAGLVKRGQHGLERAAQARVPAKAPRAARAHADGGEPDLDPLARSLAVPGAMTASSSPAAVPLPASGARAPADAFELEDAVRRIAWGGDRRRGVARLELGGSYEGTVVTVRGEGREVALRLEVRPGADVKSLPERLVERLKARGLTVTEVEVA